MYMSRFCLPVFYYFSQQMNSKLNKGIMFVNKCCDKRMKCNFPDDQLTDRPTKGRTEGITEKSHFQKCSIYISCYLLR